MNKLGINTEYYMDQNIQDTKNHCVLINPGYDFKLKAGDVVYLIKPGSVTVTKENNSEVAFGVNGDESSDELDKFLSPKRNLPNANLDNKLPSNQITNQDLLAVTFDNLNNNVPMSFRSKEKEDPKLNNESMCFV